MNEEVLTYRLLSTAKLNRTPAKTTETPPRVCLFSVRLKPRFDAEISRQSSRVRKTKPSFITLQFAFFSLPECFQLDSVLGPGRNLTERKRNKPSNRNHAASVVFLGQNSKARKRSSCANPWQPHRKQQIFNFQNNTKKGCSDDINVLISFFLKGVD